MLSGADYSSIIIAFLGGLGLFLYGMNVMSVGLQKAAGNRMKKLLGMLTRNKFMGVLVGTFVTAIIQSSSATTVMIVGFVNAGLMNLTQAVGVIMGANIGTTATSWIVSSVEWAEFLKPTTIAPIAVAIGVFLVLFAKRYSVKQIGEIIAGFGILFMGITMMTEGLSPLSDSPMFREMFATMGKNPLLGLLTGTVVTGIIQSSSASVGILQSLALSGGIVTWDAAVYIIMGQNIGTCVTAMLSSIGTSKNAKGAAYIHLLFNVLGSVIFSVAAFLLFKFAFSDLGGEYITITEISVVHTGFNVLNTLLLYPFAGVLVKTAEKITGAGRTTDEGSKSIHLDDRFLETPVFAIGNCVKETIRLGNMAVDNLSLAMEALLEKNEDKIKRVIASENDIDELENAISVFLVKLCNTDISEDENNALTSLFHTIRDMERIGDHSENLVEFAQNMIEKNLDFSDEAADELMDIGLTTIECVKNAVDALENDDRVLAMKVRNGEDAVDKLEKRLRESHLERLKKNVCDSTTGIIFLDSITNLERIADHAYNIAEVVLAKKVKRH